LEVVKRLFFSFSIIISKYSIQSESRGEEIFLGKYYNIIKIYIIIKYIIMIKEYNKNII